MEDEMEDEVVKMKKALDYADEKLKAAEATLRGHRPESDDVRALRTQVAAALSFKARVQMEYDAVVVKQREIIYREFEQYKKMICDDRAPITTSSFIR